MAVITSVKTITDTFTLTFNAFVSVVVRCYLLFTLNFMRFFSVEGKYFVGVFSLTTVHQFLRFERRWLTNLLKYGIITAEEKTRHGVNRLVT